MKFNKAITLQKDYFAVVLRQHLKFDDFRIHAALKFHREVCNFIAPKSWFVNSSSHYVFTIFSASNISADSWHVEILYEFHPSSDI